MDPRRGIPQGFILPGAHEEHPLLRPGHRHIQEPDPLRPLLHLLLPGEDGISRGIARDPVLRPLVFQADAELRVDQDALSPHPVHRPVQPRAEDHGKLQPLRFVHRHDADDIVPFRQGCRRPGVPAAGLFRYIGQEAPQRPDAAPFRLFRLAAEHLQVPLGRMPRG